MSEAASSDPSIVSEADLSLAFDSEAESMKNEVKALRQIVKELTEKPDTLLKEAAKKPTKRETAAEKLVDDMLGSVGTVRSSQRRSSAKAPELNVEEIKPVVRLFLAARGDSAKSIEKQFEKEQNVLITYKAILSEVKALATKEELADPKKVTELYSKKCQKDAQALIDTLPLSKEERSSIDNADATKALPQYQEMALLKLARFDTGKESTLADLKNEIISLKATKEKRKLEEVREELQNIGQFLDSYQELRHSTSGFPTAKERAQLGSKKAIVELSSKELQAIVKELEQGKLPKKLLAFLADSFAPNSKFLAQFASHLSEKALKQLSPMQQLWVLETKPELAKTVAKNFTESLQSDNKVSAIKTLAYIEKNQKDAKKEWQEAYTALKAALQNDPEYKKIEVLL